MSAPGKCIRAQTQARGRTSTRAGLGRQDHAVGQLGQSSRIKVRSLESSREWRLEACKKYKKIDEKDQCPPKH